MFDADRLPRRNADRTTSHPRNVGAAARRSCRASVRPLPPQAPSSPSGLRPQSGNRFLWGGRGLLSGPAAPSACGRRNLRLATSARHHRRCRLRVVVPARPGASRRRRGLRACACGPSAQSGFVIRVSLVCAGPPPAPLARPASLGPLRGPAPLPARSRPR